MRNVPHRFMHLTLALQLVALLGKVIEPLGGDAMLEEVHHFEVL